MVLYRHNPPELLHLINNFPLTLFLTLKPDSLSTKLQFKSLVIDCTDNKFIFKTVTQRVFLSEILPFRDFNLVVQTWDIAKPKPLPIIILCLPKYSWSFDSDSISKVIWLVVPELSNQLPSKLSSDSFAAAENAFRPFKHVLVVWPPLLHNSKIVGLEFEEWRNCLRFLFWGLLYRWLLLSW